MFQSRVTKAGGAVASRWTGLRQHSPACQAQAAPPGPGRLPSMGSHILQPPTPASRHQQPALPGQWPKDSHLASCTLQGRHWVLHCDY